MSSTAITSAVASCNESIASLRKEKIALLETVVEIKSQECAYWQSCRVKQQGLLEDDKKRADDASERGNMALERVLQQRIATHKETLESYQTRIALAITSELEMRGFLTEERSKLAHLECENEAAASVPASSEGNQVDTQHEELDLVRQMRALSVTTDDTKRGSKNAEQQH